MCLEFENFKDKWTQNVRCWATILGQLAIHFEERFNIDAV